MTTNTTFELSPIEEACEVTLDDVAKALPNVLIREDRAYVSSDVPPALALAVARCALTAEKVEYIGFNVYDMAMYRKVN